MECENVRCTLHIVPYRHTLYVHYTILQYPITLTTPGPRRRSCYFTVTRYVTTYYLQVLALPSFCNLSEHVLQLVFARDLDIDEIAKFNAAIKWGKNFCAKQEGKSLDTWSKMCYQFNKFNKFNFSYTTYQNQTFLYWYSVVYLSAY